MLVVVMVTHEHRLSLFRPIDIWPDLFWLGLFDHLIGALLEMYRHVKAERLGGFQIDHQLEFDRGLHGKLARFLALKNAIDIRRRAPKIIGQVISVGQQAAEFSEDTEWIDGRETVASRQRCDLRRDGRS